MPARDVYTRFIRERRFIKNVSPRTERLYEIAWKKIGVRLPDDPSRWNKRTVLDAVISMSQEKIRPTSANINIRAFNAFLRWAHEEGELHDLIKIPKQVEEKLVPTILSDTQLQAVLAWKPFDITERRLYMLFTFLADTGTRINEALTLEWDRIDWDNFLVTVFGKGRRERKIPISAECRKALFQWRKVAEKAVDCRKWVFATRNGTSLSYRNALRDFQTLKARLGITGRRMAFHAVRHTFATNFIGRGGDAFKLQRMLGHTSVQTTQKYVHLATQHLQETHEQFTLLSKKTSA